ncbi:unnamed protein product [Albugo candida]|uniref:Ras-GAP domain-containing protein n=1 Tax=Albugo candida TaxID=65357 RepID=A0A024G0R0_9STRA|nr:unnamed protein product [Albugo candida]|eukprot:CCI40160.1 unnamed protein product [Albugo candida]
MPMNDVFNSAFPGIPGFENAVRTELENVKGKHQLFLRSTSVLSSMLHDFAYRVGHSYFRNGISDIFDDARFYRDRANCEQREEIKIQEILEYVKIIIHKLARTTESGPASLRACTQHIYKEYVNAFGESESALPIAVGNVLVLRMLCPALIKPELLGFRPHTRYTLPVGIQIARVLQQTLNISLLDESTSNYKEINQFVSTFGPLFREYLCAFSHAYKGAVVIQQVKDKSHPPADDNSSNTTTGKQSNTGNEVTKMSLTHSSGSLHHCTQHKEKAGKHGIRSRLWSKVGKRW